MVVPIVDMDPDDIFRFIAESEGIKSPRLNFDRKNLLIHGFSFDQKVVEEVIKPLTSNYTTGRCTTPSFKVWYEFEDEEEFCLVVVALKLQYS